MSALFATMGMKFQKYSELKYDFNSEFITLTFSADGFKRPCYMKLNNKTTNKKLY